MEYIKCLFKDTFNILWNNLILVQPYILFYIIFGFLMLSLDEAPSIENIVIIIGCTGLIWIVIQCGWYKMIHKAVTILPEKDQTKADQALQSMGLVKDFFPGIGELFPKFLLGSIIYLFLLAIVFIALYTIGVHYIGTFDITWNDIIAHKGSQKELFEYISSIMEKDQSKFLKWELLLIIGFSIYLIINYFTMFWAQCIVFLKCNVLKAYIKSFQMVISRPIVTVTILMSAFVMETITSMITAIPACFTVFIGLILYIMLKVYFIIMLFVYFERQEDNYSSRSNCFR